MTEAPQVVRCVIGFDSDVAEARLSSESASPPGRWPQIPDTKTLGCPTTTSQKVQIDTTGQSKAGRFLLASKQAITIHRIRF